MLRTLRLNLAINELLLRKKEKKSNQMNKKALDKLNSYTSFVTGFTAGMKLEHRIFNMMCLIAIVLVAVSIPLNVSIGLEFTALLFCGLLIALMVVFYLARFRNKFKLAIISVSIFAPFVLSVNYFFSGGIWGVTLPSLVLTFFLIIIVAPRRVSGLLAMLCLASCIVLPWIEYHYPHMVELSYDRLGSRFLDTTYTSIISVLAIYIGIASLKSAYYKEKKRADLRATELEKLNNEKNKLFSIISHDLRSPLASIQNYLFLLQSQYLSQEDRLNLEQKLSITVNGTQEMLDNLLHWSKSQLEKVSTSLNENQIDETLLPLMKLQQTAAEEKGIEFHWHFNTTRPVLSDANMLQLIVRNLTSNAIKFTPKGGIIRVTAHSVTDGCLISVEDNGKGISSEAKKTIFSLSAKSTYGTANEKGVGLGLYLCHEYTRVQNGKIWHESNSENGTTFHLILRHAENAMN